MSHNGNKKGFQISLIHYFSLTLFMNTTQKICLLIFLMSFIAWITLGATFPRMVLEAGVRQYANAPYVQTWYQIVLLATWIGSLVSIYLFKD